ncbi:hypothetical protein CRG98_022197 [Punica granatum]|uniref:Uncharacterized protein n=1 Tax=Punica granatum TaxID=22663 RepID=A0A2I0JM36_PUNGR|nr:hypothetical protein CRG98_022197 [Punica granatum]
MGDDEFPYGMAFGQLGNRLYMIGSEYLTRPFDSEPQVSSDVFVLDPSFLKSWAYSTRRVTRKSLLAWSNAQRTQGLAVRDCMFFHVLGGVDRFPRHEASIFIDDLWIMPRGFCGSLVAYDIRRESGLAEAVEVKGTRMLPAKSD